LNQFTVRIERTPKKFIKGLQSSDRKRIDAALSLLATNPIPPLAKKLTDREAYRIRVGNYRILYEIHKNVLVVLVIDVGHRREIYR